VRSPGGGAITAVGAARLGLSTALAAPLGEDDAGDFVRACLQREGIALPDRRSPRTPTTVVMPVDGDRSMVTVDPGVRASASDVAALEPRAVALSLDQLYCVPPGAAAYVTCGDDDARAFARRPPAKLAGTRGLFVSKREALTLTEEDEVEAAACALARSAERVIVTLGEDGAMAVVDGQAMFAPAIEATPLDTTGAGDLLVAAYIWGDLRGASPEECLRWAVLYAGLSIATPTGVGGAVDEARLLEEGARRGLTAPPVAAS
jgi:sugar/nucleoside kinase (ribokinase family)